MAEENNSKNLIDLEEVVKILCSKKRVFFIMWPIVAILACLWVYPQPRYYDCSVALAPESGGEDVGGGLSSIASNFGISLGGGGNDAIYPVLYPELMESNSFVAGLMNIKVTTDDGSVSTDYYTYLSKHQKKNWLTEPFKKAKNSVVKMFSSKKSSGPTKGKKLDSFKLSEYDYGLFENVKEKITCSVDKKTEVITITVRDQDRLVSATMADSVRQRLQDFITDYRTRKTRLDVQHYQHLTDSANLEYRSAVNEYAQFCDANQDIILQSQQSKRDELENEMQLKYNTYTAMAAQLEAMKAKLQERTPAFTVLKSATVPIMPTGPKRLIFIVGMLVIATIVAAGWCLKDILRDIFKKDKNAGKAVYKIVEC